MLFGRQVLVGHVEREFHETSSPWKNIYLETRVIPGLHLQGGQFNMPFGLDQTTSLMNLDFNYHSLAGSYLAPGRGLGVMAYAGKYSIANPSDTIYLAYSENLVTVARWLLARSKSVRMAVARDRGVEWLVPAK